MGPRVKSDHLLYDRSEAGTPGRAGTTLSVGPETKSRLSPACPQSTLPAPGPRRASGAPGLPAACPRRRVPGDRGLGTGMGKGPWPLWRHYAIPGAPARTQEAMSQGLRVRVPPGPALLRGKVVRAAPPDLCREDQGRQPLRLLPHLRPQSGPWPPAVLPRSAVRPVSSVCQGPLRPVSWAPGLGARPREPWEAPGPPTPGDTWGSTALPGASFIALPFTLSCEYF